MNEDKKEKVTSGISETPTLDIRRYEDGKYIMNYAAEDPIASREEIKEADLNSEVKRLFGYENWDEYKRDNIKDLTRKVKRDAETGKVVAAPTVHPFHVAYAYEEFIKNFDPNDYEIVGIPGGAQKSDNKDDRVALKEGFLDDVFKWGPTEEEKGAAYAQKVIDRVLRGLSWFDKVPQEKINQLYAERADLLKRQKQFPGDFVYAFNKAISWKIAQLQGGDVDIEAGTRKQAARAAAEIEKQRKAGHRLGRASAPSAGGRVLTKMDTDAFGVYDYSGEEGRYEAPETYKGRIQSDPLAGMFSEIWSDMGYSQDIINAAQEPMKWIWLGIEILDPTGISSWPHLVAAVDAYKKNPSIENTGLLALAVVAAIPLSLPGKVDKGSKLARKFLDRTMKPNIKKLRKRLDKIPAAERGFAWRNVDEAVEFAENAFKNRPNVKTIQKQLADADFLTSGIRKDPSEFAEAANAAANLKISTNAVAAANKLDDAVGNLTSLASRPGISEELVQATKRQIKDLSKRATDLRNAAQVDPGTKILKKLWGDKRGWARFFTGSAALTRDLMGGREQVRKALSDLQGGEEPGPGTYTEKELEKMKQAALGKTKAKLEKTLTKERSAYAPKIFKLRDDFLKDGGMLEQAMRNPEEQLANKKIIDKIKSKFDLKKLFNEKITDFHVRHPNGEYWKSNYKTDKDTTSSKDEALKLNSLGEVNNSTLLSEIRSLKLQYYIFPKNWRTGNWITNKEKLFARRIGANINLSAGPAPKLPPEMAGIVSPGTIKANVAKSNVLVFGHSQADKSGQAGPYISQIKSAGGKIAHHKKLTGYSDGPGKKYPNKRLDKAILEVPKLNYTHAFLFLGGNTGVGGPDYENSKRNIIKHVTGPLGIPRENITVVLPPINLDKKDYDRRPLNARARSIFSSLGVAVAPEVVGRREAFSNDGVHLKGSSDLAKQTATSTLGTVFAKGDEAESVTGGDVEINELAKSQVARIVVDEVRKANVDPIGTLAIVYAESNFNNMLINPNSGATGTFQYMPGLKASWLKHGLEWKDKFDPREQAKAYAKIIKLNINRLRRQGHIKNSTAGSFDPNELHIIYLSWQQGSGGINNIMNAAKGKERLRADIARNMRGNFPSGAPGRADDPKDFLAFWKAKMKRNRKYVMGAYGGALNEQTDKGLELIFNLIEEIKNNELVQKQI